MAELSEADEPCESKPASGDTPHSDDESLVDDDFCKPFSRVIVPEITLSWNSKGLGPPYLATVIDEPGITAGVLKDLHAYFKWTKAHVQAHENYILHHTIAKHHPDILQWLLEEFKLDEMDVISQSALGTRIALAVGRSENLAIIDKRFSLTQVLRPHHYKSAVHLLYKMGFPGAMEFESKTDYLLTEQQQESHFLLALENGNMQALRLICQRAGGVDKFKSVRPRAMRYLTCMFEKNRDYIKEAVQILQVQRREALPIALRCILEKQHQALEVLLSSVEFRDPSLFALLICGDQPGMIVWTLLSKFPILKEF